MASHKEIHIVEGDEARGHLDDASLIHLTNRVNGMEVEDAIGLLRHQEALRILRLLAGTAVVDGTVRKIDPAFLPIEHMKGLRDSGQIAVARDGEKTVGMVGYELCGTDPTTGRNVYEIRRLAVRKEYEAQGISSKLSRVMFAKIRTADPNALVLIETNNPTVLKQCERKGYRPYPIAEGLRMQGRPAEQSNVEECQKIGDQFFLYDLSAELPASDSL